MTDMSSLLFAVKRLSSIETLENERSSPFVKLGMNTNDIDGRQETNCITIPKDDIPVLLAGEHIVQSDLSVRPLPEFLARAIPPLRLDLRKERRRETLSLWGLDGLIERVEDPRTDS